jgi:hypothetical protein
MGRLQNCQIRYIHQWDGAPFDASTVFKSRWYTRNSSKDSKITATFTQGVLNRAIELRELPAIWASQAHACVRVTVCLGQK